MRPISSTCRPMIDRYSENCWLATSSSGLYLRRSLSAASWIGVSGFLISCAIRRAISDQAALRCAARRSVTSSNVTTYPMTRPSTFSVAILARSVNRLPSPVRMICSSTNLRRLEAPLAIRLANSGTTSSSRLPIRSVSARCRSWHAVMLGSVTLRSLSRPITPEDTPERTASVNSRRRSICMFACTSCSRLRVSSSSMLLNERPSRAISSTSRPSGTRSDRLPSRTCSATEITEPSGSTIAVARLSPIQSAVIRSSARMRPKTKAKLTCRSSWLIPSC